MAPGAAVVAGGMGSVPMKGNYEIAYALLAIVVIIFVVRLIA